MQEKDRFLKKQINLKSFLMILFIIFFFKNCFGAEVNYKIENYFKNLNLFSSKFIQSNENFLQEGYIYIDNAKIRLDYFEPDRSIKISQNKGVYINHELKEEEFFSTKNNLVKIFYDIFLDESFFLSLSFEENKKEIIFKKNIFLESESIALKIFFENDPLLLRKIVANTNGGVVSISFMEHNYNNTFDKDFFSFVPIYLD